MLRLAHTADLHLTDGRRFADTRACLEHIVEDGRAHGVDAWLVVGDLTGTTVPHRASPTERNALAAIFQAMAQSGPVVIVVGNHDQADDVAIFGRLKGVHPIIVVDRPAIVDLSSPTFGGPPLRLYCLPYPQKAWLLAGGIEGTVEDQNARYAGGLREILAHWRLDAEQARAAGLHTVGAMHINVGGSKVAGGEVLIGQEIELAPHDLDELALDYVALGHIHLHQAMAQRAWYSGSPSAQDFGATDAKGYCLVDIEAGCELRVEHRPTPSRKLVTVDVRWNPDTQEFEQDAAPIVEGAEVRVRVAVDESCVASCPLDRLTQIALDAGAHAVDVERRVVPKTRVRSEAIAAALTLPDQITAYFDSLGRTGPDAAQRQRALAKLADLEAPTTTEDVAA